MTREYYINRKLEVYPVPGHYSPFRCAAYLYKPFTVLAAASMHLLSVQLYVLLLFEDERFHNTKAYVLLKYETGNCYLEDDCLIQVENNMDCIVE